MAKQLEIFQNRMPEQIFKKMRWDKRETFWRTVVHNTGKEHLCARCENTIPENSRAEITVDLENGKPNFSKPQYWHPNEKCPNI